MLRPQPLPPIPDDTARIARAAFRKGHPYLRLADELGTLFSDETFAALFPSHGQPALAPWRLAFVTILQFAEGLSDRQAADAVRGRIDWKYLLRLELADAGVPACGSRRLGAGRVPRATHRGRGGASAARHPPGVVPRAAAAQGARSPAHRLDAGAGGGARAQPRGTGRRDGAPRAEQPGRRSDGLAGRAAPARLGRPLCPSRGRRPPADEAGGASGVGRGHRARRGGAARRDP